MWTWLEKWFTFGGNVQLHTSDRQRLEPVLGSREWPDANAYDLVNCDRKTRGCLYIGDISALEDPRFIGKMDAVVSAISSKYTPRSYLDLMIPQNKGLLFVDIEDQTDANMGQFLLETYEYIQQHLNRGQTVFVHCIAGRSRSATIVVYYLMRRYGMSLVDALAFLKKRRPLIRPNDAFLAQLVKAERQLFG